MRRAAFFVFPLALFGLSAADVVAQSSDATLPEFEVATIKPSKSSESVKLKLSDGGIFTATGTSFSDLIKLAYDVHVRQIIGGPAWLETEKYDVVGKPAKPGKPSFDELKAMVQKLLADRFQLTLRHDKRELPVYAITVAKSGPKMIRNDSDPNGLPVFNVGPRALRFTNATMTEFARILQGAGRISDRPMVDQTGLGSVRYDLSLKWTPDAPPPDPGRTGPAANNADAPPDLFAAFQQQLGLKLESTKAPVDVLVIEHVERPSAN
jgi:uncharacterized protein (TIGR03435 family)